MVRLIFLLIIVSFYGTRCLGQHVSSNEEMNLSFVFSKDTVYLGDSVLINISYTNKSKQSIIFYPIAFVQMITYNPKQDEDTLIFLSNVRIRFPYTLNSKFSKNDTVILNYGKTYSISYSIKITEKHFFKGENKVQIRYWYKNKKYSGESYVLFSDLESIFVKNNNYE